MADLINYKRILDYILYRGFMKLNDYAVKYGTDKQIDKHGYVKYYEQWLEHKRNDKIKLLEKKLPKAIINFVDPGSSAPVS